jgi:peptide deformylase
MAVRQIVIMGHPILQRSAEPVDDPTSAETRAIVQDMIDTLIDVSACGIAAPQIYSSKRIFTYRLTAERIPLGSTMVPIDWTTMINPVVTPVCEEKVPVWERCLSIPGLHGKVPRFPQITVKHLTLEGKVAETYAEGWLAAIFQHEIDHLDGILYPMRMTDLALLAFNSSPGRLAQDAATGTQMDPLYRKMVEGWPERDRWSGAEARTPP